MTCDADTTSVSNAPRNVPDQNKNCHNPLRRAASNRAAGAIPRAGHFRQTNHEPNQTATPTRHTHRDHRRISESELIETETDAMM
jgi:hypothetical protein